MSQIKSSKKVKSKVIDVNSVVFEIGDLESTYTYELDVFMKDVNQQGDVYFARHFEWQGCLREAWIRDHVAPLLGDAPIKMVTKEVTCIYDLPAKLGMRVLGKLKIIEVKNASAVMSLKFYNMETQQLISTGTQKVLLLGPDEKIIRIPKPLEIVLKKFM